MLDEMINIAKNKLIEDKELPSSQLTVLLSDKNNFYVAIDDFDGLICEKLKHDKKTKIAKMLTMWQNGCIDLSSIKFRNALVLMDEYNKNTDIILQGSKGYLIKKLAVTILEK